MAVIPLAPEVEMSFGMQTHDRKNLFEPESGRNAGTHTAEKTGATHSGPSATFSVNGFPNPLIRPRRRFGVPRRLDAGGSNTSSGRPSCRLLLGMEPSTATGLTSETRRKA